VWWYSGMMKNLKDRTQPSVAVVFREMFADGSLGEYFVRRISLTAFVGASESCDNMGK